MQGSTDSIPSALGDEQFTKRIAAELFIFWINQGREKTTTPTALAGFAIQYARDFDLVWQQHLAALAPKAEATPDAYDVLDQRNTLEESKS